MSIHFRLATLSDLSQVFALDQLIYGNHSFPQFVFRQYYDISKGLFWVAESDHKIISYLVGAVMTGKEGFALSLATHPNFQGQGIGKKLFEKQLEAYRLLGVSRVFLTVAPTNPAFYLYEKLGFQILREEENYFGGGEKRTIMEYLF